MEASWTYLSTFQLGIGSGYFKLASEGHLQLLFRGKKFGEKIPGLRFRWLQICELKFQRQQQLEQELCSSEASWNSRSPGFEKKFSWELALENLDRNKTGGSKS